MPRKTRRRISGTRKSRRIRRRGTRRIGTRIRGGNRRYHNGGGFFSTYWSNAEEKVQDKFNYAKEAVRNARQKLNDAIGSTTTKLGMTIPTPTPTPIPSY